ncbi:hypothetical protein I4F81_000061 [Pyropia yezoensis]|uniref:Uncharacterized protein n=1 Tax=Pyropia yezoensis TaxID=2788 RepID=A0ACC3BHV5_PYRYE|nr:hypothetical protein I4F81_000061 [Neopyropia yezoensis]
MGGGGGRGLGHCVEGWVMAVVSCGECVVGSARVCWEGEGAREDALLGRAKGAAAGVGDGGCGCGCGGGWTGRARARALPCGGRGPPSGRRRTRHTPATPLASMRDAYSRPALGMYCTVQREKRKRIRTHDNPFSPPILWCNPFILTCPLSPPTPTRRHPPATSTPPPPHPPSPATATAPTTPPAPPPRPPPPHPVRRRRPRAAHPAACAARWPALPPGRRPPTGRQVSRAPRRGGGKMTPRGLRPAWGVGVAGGEGERGVPPSMLVGRGGGAPAPSRPLPTAPVAARGPHR